MLVLAPSSMLLTSQQWFIQVSQSIPISKPNPFHDWFQPQPQPLIGRFYIHTVRTYIYIPSYHKRIGFSISSDEYLYCFKLIKCDEFIPDKQFSTNTHKPFNTISNTSFYTITKTTCWRSSSRNRPAWWGWPSTRTVLGCAPPCKTV